MNYLATFKDFYIQIVLPNIPSYQGYFGIADFDSKIISLIEAYKKSFTNDPFEVTDIEANISTLKKNLGHSDNDFSKYSDKIGSGIPRAILSTHFPIFLTYYGNQIAFADLQTLIDKVNKEINVVGRNEDFIKKFREYRKDSIGQSRIVKPDLLFGDVRDDYWTINIGAEKELQYHIHLNDAGCIKYGLGFNIQASANNHDPVENARPFRNAFYSCKAEVDRILQDYSFWDNEEDNLQKLNYGTFILYGREIAYEEVADDYEIKGLDYLKMLYDLKYKQFKAYKLIFENSKKSSQQLLNSVIMENYIALLQYKKQIILQGPPGTGKTRLAKEIAEKMIDGNKSTTRPETFNDDLVKNVFKVGSKIPTPAGNTMYHILDVLPDRIKSQKENETIDETLFGDIERAYHNQSWKHAIDNNPQRRAAAFAKYIFDQHLFTNKPANNEQCKIIQFHPSYNYEDFVRGITSKHNEEGEGVLYKAENRILATIAETALNNYLSSKGELPLHSAFQNKLDRLLEDIRNKIEEGTAYMFGDKSTGKIIAIKEDGLLYHFPTREDIHYKILFSDLEKIFNVSSQIEKPIDLRDLERPLGLVMKGKYPYYYMLLKKLEAFKDDTQQTQKQELKNYVLIIDEINRANLSGVLGELIYALEYRGEAVESIYDVDGNTLTIPPNLYIIGTMNTADRSVGHIDYAIRRRFAFVEVAPQALQDNEEIYFNTEAYTKVAALFTPTNVSSEFEPKDVQIGHSYFIAKKKEATDDTKKRDIFRLKIDYEIIPILNEYVKDGVLVGDINGKSIKHYIEELKSAGL